MVTFYNGIEDVPDGSLAVTIHKLDADVNRLLKHTDQCTYHDEYGFSDRFGWTLPWQCLSTGGNNAAADAAQLPHIQGGS